MSKGIFIIGTDTDVGKTFVTAGITYVLRKNGFNACSYKAVQSGGVYEGTNLVSGDVKFVKDITDIEEAYEVMNSYCLKTEVSPHIASEIENVKIHKKILFDGYKKLKEKYDFIIAEGSGGAVVPLIRNNYYIYNLIKDLDIPTVIVARAGVGTINHTVLTVEFLKSKGIDIKGIIINGYEGTFYEDDNIRVIKDITGLDIISVINKVKAKEYENLIEKSREEYEKNITIENIKKVFED
ncbi:dethiobiotin synthase [Clostridium ganghwense]|uniref:ATP-dependent dethiobiotin synthetase BioD n=1 Tax=Clostridium ganghwense TaxID=312089 RepID=A0ABT4CP02_9CLOT|nr:dethiobiotin synthase [Clostridium ganghwense]MCY6370795.1 dethiobiotin synthase [Clostridium ganghwense]